MGATFRGMVCRAVLVGCTVALLAAPVGAEVSQRDQQRQAQRAYEESVKQYDEVAKEAQKWKDRAETVKEAAETVLKLLERAK